MSVESLNSRIPAYKAAFASGELQQTYQDLVAVVQHIRIRFNKHLKSEFSIANVLHGYIDFTYFYLQNKLLKKQKLKLAIVLNHQQTRFEVQLLGQTKDVQLAYWKKLKGTKWVDTDVMPEYSIFEMVLMAKPDFDDIDKLSESIHLGFITLSQEIFNTLEEYE